MVRRGEQVIRDVPARLLIPNIKSKKLRGSDEISADGKYWVRLDKQHQLCRFFTDQSESSIAVTKPPGIEDQMAELAEMLKDINGR